MLAQNAGDDKSMAELINEATSKKSIEECNAHSATKKQAFSRFKY